MHTRRFLLSSVVIAGMGALLLAQPRDQRPSGLDMAEAANRFLDTLSEEQRQRATYEYDDPERLNWHFIPRERNGLPLKDMDDETRQAAHRLVRSGLSEVGYDQSLNIMSLEEVLYLLEGGEREVRRQRRDPLNYYVTIFGSPAERGTWGWRLEGHHLSLNYSITDGKVVASTPEFYGANPAKIDAGPERTIRVLGPEEDLARAVFKLCTAEQRRMALIDREAPDDIRAGGVPQPPVTEPVGLPVARMGDDQKRLMRDLLTEYLQNMPGDVERNRRSRINQAGIDNIYFAWWGDAEPDRRHHYRIQGPTFLIEYNNTQNNANHIHAVWRNVDGDLNVPIRER